MPISSARMASSIALRTSGRLSVTVATCSSIETSTAEGVGVVVDIMQLLSGRDCWRWARIGAQLAVMPAFAMTSFQRAASLRM